jgi:uncharacterized LabA/DUF88 family protein
MSSLRTNIYIDGFNLYYGKLKGTPYKWINLKEMCHSNLDSNKNSIQKIKYFTALVKPRPSNPDQNIRQQAYIRALTTIPEIEIIYGHFLSHEVTMPLADGSGVVKVIKTEEKRSDVNIAVHLLHDAYKNDYDCAVLVSNDSDLTEPLRIINKELGKVVGILNPQKTQSMELAKYAHFIKKIQTWTLKNSLFPNQLQDSKGIITRPNKW